MYHLSHLLHEDETLAQSLQKMTILPSGNDQDSLQAEGSERKSLASILETVEGCSSVTSVPGRYLVHSGPLTEVDPESSEDLQDIYAFLLNDSLMITTLNKKRKGPIRYKYQSLLELDNMAVLSVVDTDVMKNAFRILLFPISHTFKTTSSAAKKQWMAHIDVTKQKHKMSLTLPKTVEELGDRRSPDRPVFQHQRDSKRADSPESSGEWLKNVPENLDVFIAQREFEKAVNLVIRSRTFLKDMADSHAHRDVRAKLGNRISQLSDLLMKELEASPSGSLRGGPKAARKAISLLLKLGRAAQACDLFLKSHSLLIRYEIKLIKLEGATSLYITKLSKAFFQGLGTAAEEFERAFTNNHGSYSAFTIWCMDELKEYTETFCGIVFSQKSLFNVSECVVAAQTACEALENKGLSLTYALMGYLNSHLCQALTDAKDEVIKACRGKASEEVWEPMDFRTDPAQLSALALEMENIGIADFRNLVSSGGIIDISKTTFTFCKLAFGYVTEVLRFYVPELYEVFVDCFCEFSKHIVSIFINALSIDQFLPSYDFIQRNATFTIETVLPSIGIKIEKALGGITIPEIVDLVTALQRSIQSYVNVSESDVVV